MGFVGELVRANVTTKLWPSHPLVDNRSAYRSVSRTRSENPGGTYDKSAMLHLHS